MNLGSQCMNDLPNKAHWYPQPPASSEAVEALRTQSGLDLPRAYLAFFEQSNGGDGDLGIAPGWLSLWSIEEVLGLNRDYEVQQWIPGFFGFGTNGGGELLAFDTRTPHPWKIYMIPFVPMDANDALLVAEDFASFAQAIGRSQDDTEAADDA